MNGTPIAVAIRRGVAAREAGNYTAALLAFEAVITANPESPVGFFYAADLHLRETRCAMAVKLSKTGLALPCTQQNRSFGLQIRALALMQLKLRREALAAAAEAVANDAANASNHRVLGQVLWSNKRFKAAEAAFQQAIALAPEMLSPLTTYARYLKTMGRLAEAEAVVERAALIEPDGLDVMILRGQIAFRLERLEMARDLALWALSRAAMNRGALELLAMVKSRRSWFTAPFWIFSNLLSRLQKTYRMIIFVAIGAGLGLFWSQASTWVGGGRAMFAVIATDGFWCVLGYICLCAAHVGWLVRRDLRLVALKRNF